MKFKPGQSGNPNGRPKGKPNKATASARTLLSFVLDSNTDRLQAELDKLEGKEFIDAIAKLLPYVLPRLQATEITDSTDAESKRVVIRLGGKDIVFS